tara:strand:- start:29206 stop:29655 length:450 start_codon:yes stop_codon:yes gene_type:complete
MTDEEMADARTMKEDKENVENLNWLNNRVNELQTELNRCRENIESRDMEAAYGLLRSISGKFTYPDIDCLGRNTYVDSEGRPHVRGYGIELINDLKQMIERQESSGKEWLYLDFEVCISDRWVTDDGQYQCNITNLHGGSMSDLLGKGE